MPRCLYECIRRRGQEEVVLQDLLGNAKLLLCLLKVEIKVESTDEIGKWIRVLVSLLPHDPDEVLQLLLVSIAVSAPVPVRDDGGGEVSEDPWAECLDRVDVCRREKQLDELVLSRLGGSAGFVVEEREQRPVDEPRPALQLRERVAEEPRLDAFLDLVDFLHGRLPLGGQDFRRKLAPRRRSDFIVVRRLFCQFCVDMPVEDQPEHGTDRAAQPHSRRHRNHTGTVRSRRGC